MKRLGIFIRFISIVIGVLTIIILVKWEFKPVIETKNGDQTEVPNDVQTDTLRRSVSSLTAYKVPILLYHYVEYVKDKKDTIRESLNVTPNIFEEQIKTLIANNYTFMTAKEMGEVIDGKKELPGKPVLLTFDDGHWDFDTEVLPILKKYNIKATAYIITGFIGGSDFMSKGQLQNVIDSGLVDVGAHTVHHVALKGRLYLIAQYEISESKNWLKSNYGVDAVSFAYPNGSFDKQAIDLVKNAGYTTGVSTIPGVTQSTQNRFYLYRLRPGYRTGANLINFLESRK